MAFWLNGRSGRLVVVDLNGNVIEDRALRGEAGDNVGYGQWVGELFLFDVDQDGSDDLLVNDGRKVLAIRPGQAELIWTWRPDGEDEAMDEPTDAASPRTNPPRMKILGLYATPDDAAGGPWLAIERGGTVYGVAARSGQTVWRCRTVADQSAAAGPTGDTTRLEPIVLPSSRGTEWFRVAIRYPHEETVCYRVTPATATAGVGPHALPDHDPPVTKVEGPDPRLVLPLPWAWRWDYVHTKDLMAYGYLLLASLLVIGVPAWVAARLATSRAWSLRFFLLIPVATGLAITVLLAPWWDVLANTRFSPADGSPWTRLLLAASFFPVVVLLYRGAIALKCGQRMTLVRWTLVWLVASVLLAIMYMLSPRAATQAPLLPADLQVSYGVYGWYWVLVEGLYLASWWVLLETLLLGCVRTLKRLRGRRPLPAGA